MRRTAFSEFAIAECANKIDSIGSPKATYIPYDLFNKSLNEKAENNFLTFLESRVGKLRMQEARQRFRIGSAKHWHGSTVFWQIDEQMKIRTGKIMLYDIQTGKRVKKPVNHIDWVHSTLLRSKKIERFTLTQCLFGLHQLFESKVSEIAIVESEKTAVISSLYMPHITWMASGGLSMISADRLQSIKDHPIVLYPDLGGFKKWNEKAAELISHGFRVVVSDVLEKSPSVSEVEKEAGFDIADYLLRISLPDTPLQRLIKLNPVISALVSRFDLFQID